MVTFIMMMHIMRQFGPPHKKTYIMAVTRDGSKQPAQLQRLE